MMQSRSRRERAEPADVAAGPVAAPLPSTPVPLGTKLTPSRAGGVSTFEALLATAGELLGEVGFEGLSTNLICSRAGMTPPALYRYFPNKYAVLQELGRRLMKAQDDAVFAWMEAGGLDTKTLGAAVRSNQQLQAQVNAITRRHPGGIWIMRALRAVPVLHEVRMESRDDVARRVAEILHPQFPALTADQMLAATRLSTEMMYAATEMAMEAPEQEEQITNEVCWMVCTYYGRLNDRYAASGPPA
jgi:AcrR family transcriptional regulator